MSIIDAKKYFELFTEDEEFRTKYLAVGDDKEAKLEVIGGYGLDFTKEEFIQVSNEIIKENPKEVSAFLDQINNSKNQSNSKEKLSLEELDNIDAAGLIGLFVGATIGATAAYKLIKNNEEITGVEAPTGDYIKGMAMFGYLGGAMGAMIGGPL